MPIVDKTKPPTHESGKVTTVLNDLINDTHSYKNNPYTQNITATHVTVGLCVTTKYVKRQKRPGHAFLFLWDIGGRDFQSVHFDGQDLMQVPNLDSEVSPNTNIWFYTRGIIPSQYTGMINQIRQFRQSGNNKYYMYAPAVLSWWNKHKTEYNNCVTTVDTVLQKGNLSTGWIRQLVTPYAYSLTFDRKWMVHFLQGRIIH